MKNSQNDIKISSFIYKYLKFYYPEEFKDINYNEASLYDEKIFQSAFNTRLEHLVQYY